MKKLILFFTVAVAATMMTGCDRFVFCYFEVTNETASDIIVEVDGQNPIIINPNDSKVIYDASGLGSVGDYYGLEENMLPFKVKINNRLMSISIWKRKYWRYERNGKNSETYTLVITEELIEALLSENNPNS